MNILIYHWDIYPYDNIIKTFQKCPFFPYPKPY